MKTRPFWAGLMVVVVGAGLASFLTRLAFYGGVQLSWHIPVVLQFLLDGLVVGSVAGLSYWLVTGEVLKHVLREERAYISQEQRLNADLTRALDEHALVSIADVKGKIIFANDKFCQVSGYSREELLDQDHRLVNSGQHGEAYFREMWRRIAKGEVWQGEFCNRRKDGSLYWVDSTILPFLDEGGKPYQYVAVRRDITEFKEAKHRASRLGDRLQWIMDASPSVVYAHENMQSLSTCTFVSGNVRAVTGYTSEQMLQVSNFWLQNLHPEDRKTILEGLQTLTEKGWMTLEYRFKTATGDYLWIRDNARVVNNEAGKAQAIVGSWTDITTTKAIEQAHHRLLMAVEASAEMIFLTDEKGLIQYANPSFCRFTGWGGEEVIGLPSNIMSSGHTPTVVYEEMRKALQAGKPWRGRMLNRRKKGAVPPNAEPAVKLFGAGVTHRRKDDPLDILADPSDPLLYWADVSINPIWNPEGKPLGFVSFQRDISSSVFQEARLTLKRLDTEARLEVVEILNQSDTLEERFGKVLERLFELPDLSLQKKAGVFLSNRQTNSLNMFVLKGDFSEEFIERERHIPFGACLCGRAAVSGEVLISDDCFCDTRHEHRFAGMQNHGHYIIPLATGSEIFGVLFLYTEPNPNYSPERVDILKQIGESMAFALIRNQAKRMVEQARDEALSASRQKSEFLANMSHEIRTPMNGVLGMLEILRRTPLSNEQREYVDTVGHSAETLLSIINSILDFSKIESGHLELDRVDFELRELVEEVCTLLATSAFNKGIELNCFVESKLPTQLRGDPTRLRQILMNLIGNAVKFTETGEVDVEVCSQFQDDQHVLLKFLIKDTGIGIPQEDFNRIFRAFEQADGATTRRFGGTGLGLSITKGLVACMGGSEIYVDSKPGIGSTFWFTLRFERQLGTPYPTTEKSLNQRRVLVVDDNETNRTILSCFIQDWGGQVEAVEDGFQALDRLNKADLQGNPYELVILDMNMPDMDGLMLSRAMNREPKLVSTPRILLSSGGTITEVERVEAGIHQSLTKPVRQSILFDALMSCLNEPWFRPMNTPASGNSELPKLNGLRVLLVEDNPVNQRVALKMLECFELRIKLANNGEEALKAFEEDRFDLVLMDCQMPVMDGYAATRGIRNLESQNQLTRTPVIALTANAMEGDREKCIAAGMDDHLAKPFMLNGLAEIINLWMNPMTKPDTTAATAPLPLWNREEALSRLGGAEELLEEIKILYIDESARQLAILRDPAATTAQLASSAHSLKGMLMHFCAHEAVASAADVERYYRSGEGNRDYPKRAELIEWVEKLADAFR